MVFLSDNGGPSAPGMSNGSVNAPFRGGDWKLIRQPDRLPLLYHLSADPTEQNDLALREIDRTRSLMQALGRWEVRSPNPVFREPADWRTGGPGT